MSDKTVKQLEQEILEVQIARLINKQNEVVLKKGVTFGEIVYSQQNTAKKIIAFLREHIA